MDRTRFKKILSEYIKFRDILDSLYNMGISMIESPIFSYGYSMLKEVLDDHFNEIAIEDIEWWLFEKSLSKNLKMFDKDGNEIPTETLDDLWEIVSLNLKK